MAGMKPLLGQPGGRWDVADCASGSPVACAALCDRHACGIARSHTEGGRFAAALGADSCLVASGASGPFTTSTPIPSADADRVRAVPGVVRAAPLVVLHSTPRRP